MKILSPEARIVAWIAFFESLCPSFKPAYFFDRSYRAAWPSVHETASLPRRNYLAGALFLELIGTTTLIELVLRRCCCCNDAPGSFNSPI